MAWPLPEAARILFVVKSLLDGEHPDDAAVRHVTLDQLPTSKA
jgi:hypothetical protein